MQRDTNGLWLDCYEHFMDTQTLEDTGSALLTLTSERVVSTQFLRMIGIVFTGTMI